MNDAAFRKMCARLGLKSDADTRNGRGVKRRGGVATLPPRHPDTPLSASSPYPDGQRVTAHIRKGWEADPDAVGCWQYFDASGHVRRSISTPEGVAALSAFCDREIPGGGVWVLKTERRSP